MGVSVFPCDVSCGLTANRVKYLCRNLPLHYFGTLTQFGVRLSIAPRAKNRSWRLQLSSLGPESEKEMIEKRQWKRYDVDVRLRVTARTNGSVRSVYGRGTDVSIGGMSAFLAIDLPEREIIEVDVTLPYTSQPLKLKVTVCNRSGYKYGLKFVDITPSQQMLIKRTCGALEFTQ